MTSYDAAKRRHNIGSSGVCENCGCSEAAIAKFGWDCGLEDTAPRNTKSRLIWSYIALAVTFTVAVTSWWLPRYFPDVAEFAMQLDNEFVDILLVILLPLIAATVYFLY
ncbi:MAG: hypothetical protein OER56_16715, partial [Hyphomicrobiales bacterium]|nr:hypothetical protein [Hyphomicrobiales bacterium]